MESGRNRRWHAVATIVAAAGCGGSGAGGSIDLDLSAADIVASDPSITSHCSKILTYLAGEHVDGEPAQANHTAYYDDYVQHWPGLVCKARYGDAGGPEVTAEIIPATSDRGANHGRVAQDWVRVIVTGFGPNVRVGFTYESSDGADNELYLNDDKIEAMLERVDKVAEAVDP